MTTATTTCIVETILFKAKPGVGDAQILEAAEALEQDLAKYPGYLGRRFLKGEDGQWMELLEWTGLDEAKAAEAIIDEPCAQAFDALVEMGSVQMIYFRPVQALGGADLQ
jgi:hypothetical protein